MSSTLQAFVRSLYPSNLTATSSIISICRPPHHYSTAAEKLQPRDWKTAGYAAPRSLSQKEPKGILEELNEPDEQASNLPHSSNFAPLKPPTPDEWKSHRETMRSQFPQGWAPPRRLSRDAMEGLRSLHAYDPATFSTPVLAQKFHVSPEAVRRILRSKWQPTKDERARMVQREQKTRQEWIKQRRVEERMRDIAAQLEGDQGGEPTRVEAADQRDGSRRDWDRKRSGKVRGINRYDKLTLQ